MKNLNVLISAVLIILAVIAIIAASLVFRSVSVKESEFNRIKADLIKENLDLKDRIDNLLKITTEKEGIIIENQLKISEKDEKIAFLKEEKNAIKSELDMLKKRTQEIENTYSIKLDALKQENEFLTKKVSELEKLERRPTLEQLKEALAKQEDEKVKKILEEVGYEVEIVEPGEPVELEPIVVNSGDTGSGGFNNSFANQENAGEILSVDVKNNLIAISMGRKDNLEEGQRCLILKDGKRIASAEIISVRYRISAAFVDDIEYTYSINSLEKGDSVLVPR
jgi:hypothetical protein